MERAQTEELRGFVASIVSGLQRWDPHHADAATPSTTSAQAKQDFIDALTEISALPSDSLDMEVRRLVVNSDDQDALHLRHLVAALSHRDVLLKCKVANAIGSLCTSRVAGQRLLDRFGEALLPPLIRMATGKNIWAQADAFFVFGWIVVVGEDALVQQHLVRYISLAIKLLHRNLAKQSKLASIRPTSIELEEQDANLRVYGLVFLLNFSQRDVNALEQDLDKLLEMLLLLFSRLLSETATIWPTEEDDDWRERFVEHVEFVRLAVTLLSGVVVEVEAAPAMAIALKMLPTLLKLDQALHSEELRRVWRRVTKEREEANEAGEEAKQEEEEKEEEVEEDGSVLAELKERMRIIKETVLASR